MYQNDYEYACPYAPEKVLWLPCKHFHMPQMLGLYWSIPYKWNESPQMVLH